MEIAVQTERRWPDPRTGPWLLRVSFAADADTLVPVGVEVWAIRPPVPSSRWTAWQADLPAAERPPVPLTPAGLRIPLARLADQTATAASQYAPAARARGRQEAPTLEALAKTRRRRGRPPLYPPDHFAAVADAYRETGGRRPTADVADRFGVSRSTAAHWITRCRRMGLIR